MAKRCPYCGSYNVDPVISRYVGQGLRQVGRFALSAGAGLGAGLFSPQASHHVAHAVWHNTKPSGEFKGYHCNNCGKDFSAS